MMKIFIGKKIFLKVRRSKPYFFFCLDMDKTMFYFKNFIELKLGK